jgi:hypothetical protein
MQTGSVIVMAPLVDDDLGFFQAVEDFAIEQFVTQFAVEGLTVTVFPRTSRFDVQGFGANLSEPIAHDLRSHFRAIVRSDVLRHASFRAPHLIISVLQMQGIEVGLVAKPAGHSNPNVTLGHYTQAVRGGARAFTVA